MNPSLAHKFSSHHRESILKSQTCGCFYCLQIFPPTEIKDWCDPNKEGIGQTAICPKCGVDSIVGDTDIKINLPFLKKMHHRWFKPTLFQSILKPKIIIIAIIITFIIFTLITLTNTGSNQCEFNGIKYAEFTKHPVENCQCQGRGNGYDNALWICQDKK